MSYKPKPGDYIDHITPYKAPSGIGLWIHLRGQQGRVEPFVVDGTGRPGSAVALSALLPVFHAVYLATTCALAEALENAEPGRSSPQPGIYIGGKEAP